jgi:hypothetical protein
MPSPYLPTLYKARKVPTKQVVCAICVDRTRGRTQLVRLGYGVSVWLCAGHGSREFQAQRSGRDFVLTLHQLWQAHGCLTAARSKALSAHLASLRAGKLRGKPGSYAWPDLRRAVERSYARGAPTRAAIAHVTATYGACPARPPSPRTLHRWHAERRWLAAPGTGPPLPI